MLVEQRKRRGATVCRVVTYSGAAPWRKHGRDRDVKQDPTLAALDAMAAQRAAPCSPRGYLVRKCRG